MHFCLFDQNGLNSPLFLGDESWLSGLSFGLIKAGLSRSQTGTMVVLCVFPKEMQRTVLLCVRAFAMIPLRGAYVYLDLILMFY